MFKQTRTLNLNFIGIILFAITFLVGGFFTNIQKVLATESVQIFNVSYSLSQAVSSQNNDGGTTTIVHVGCAIGSGDLFDINTGKACTQYVTTSVRIGCAPFSKDLFDINTGKRCTNNTTPIMIGCLAGSGHLFDITNGKKCTNDTKPILTGCKAGSGDLFDTTTGKACNVETKKITTTPASSTFAINKDKDIVATSTKTVEKTIDYNAPILLSTIESNEESQSEEKSENRLAASVEKIGLVFKGPLSIWIILLIGVIVLSGGYGIYSFVNKDDKDEAVRPNTETQVKTPAQIPPIITSQNTQTQNLNKAPIQENNQPQSSILQNDPKNPVSTTPVQETLLKK